jgi:hypothetical protein
MYRRLPKDIKFTPQYKRLLRNTVIDETSPGTILHDFDALLAFLAENETLATGTHQLSLRALPEINARLARPLRLGLKRPQQRSYPHIQGLFLLSRASGQVCIGGTSKKPLLVVDAAVHQGWENLNPTERYCTLLETWLMRALPEIVGERSGPGRVPETFRQWQWFFLRIPRGSLPIAGDPVAEKGLRDWPGWHNLGLVELFGFVSIHHGPPEPGKGWRIDRIQRTPLGDALLALLQVGFFGEYAYVVEFESEGEIPFGFLQPVLQPYFPEWQNNLSIPAWTFREGAHVFKVSWSSMYRRIAVPADQTLDALASATLDAVKFDHDHLYRFWYENRFGVRERVNHPEMDEAPWTSEVLIGDVPLQIGQTMTYLYDFGDRWEFGVTLERVDPDRTIDRPVVLEKHGRSPSQYGW